MLAAPRQRCLLSHCQPNLACGEFCERRAGGGAARQAGGDGSRFRGWRRRISPLFASLAFDPVSRGDIPRLEWRRANRRSVRSRALLALFEGLTKDAPVLALLEDAHWIDPSSLDVFNRLVDRLPICAPSWSLRSGPEFAAALGWPGARPVVGAQPLGTAPRACHDRSGRRRQGAAARGSGSDRRQDRRRTAVCGGIDQDRAGVRPAARRQRVLRSCFALTPLAIPSTLQDFARWRGSIV